MIFTSLEAEKDLRETGYNIVYAFPDNFETLPAVSFYTANETPVYSTSALFSERATVVVDVWVHEDDEPLTGEMCGKIDSVMYEKGWFREYSADVPDRDSRVNHHTMRFTKFFKE